MSDEQSWQSWQNEVNPAYNLQNPLPRIFFECAVTLNNDVLSQAITDMTLNMCQSDLSSPDDALDFLEFEVGLPRYTNEDAATYRAIVQNKWNIWAQVGPDTFTLNEIKKAIPTCTPYIIYDVVADKVGAKYFQNTKGPDIPPSGSDPGGYNDVLAPGYVRPSDGVNIGWPSQFEVWIVLPDVLLETGKQGALGYSDLMFNSHLEIDTGAHVPVLTDPTPVGPLAIWPYNHWPNHQVYSRIVNSATVNDVRTIIKKFKPGQWRCNSIKFVLQDDLQYVFVPKEIAVNTYGSTTVYDHPSPTFRGVEKFAY